MASSRGWRWSRREGPLLPPRDSPQEVREDNLSAEEYYGSAMEDLPQWKREVAEHQIAKGTWELTEATLSIQRHSIVLVRLTRWLVVLTAILSVLTLALIWAAVIGR